MDWDGPFEDWFTALTMTAYFEFGFSLEAVRRFNRSAWRPLYLVGCPPRHALLLSRPYLNGAADRRAPEVRTI